MGVGQHVHGIALTANARTIFRKGGAAMAREIQSVSVSKLLELVRKASEDAQAAIAASELPLLSAVDLTLETALKLAKGIDGDLFLLSGGWKDDETTTQTLSIKLTRPSPKQPVTKSFARDLEASIYAELRNAMVNASLAAKAAYKAMLSGFELNSITSSVTFDLTDEKNVGLKFKIWRMGVGEAASKTESGQHKISLTFEKPTSQ
jgi:hypothetical protein